MGYDNKHYSPPLYQVGLVAIPFYVNYQDWINNDMKEHITKLNKFSDIKIYALLFYI